MYTLNIYHLDATIRLIQSSLYHYTERDVVLLQRAASTVVCVSRATEPTTPLVALTELPGSAETPNPCAATAKHTPHTVILDNCDCLLLAYCKNNYWWCCGSMYMLTVMNMLLRMIIRLLVVVEEEAVRYLITC
jgi:hypothetical protein